MTDDERQELVAMRHQLVGYLVQTQDQIIVYPVRENDADFQFLTRKAIYYQDMIDNQLKESYG